MIKEEFKAELDRIMALPAEEVRELKKAPKKGQALNGQEVQFIDQRLKASLAGAAPTNAEQARDNRDWVEAIRAHYKVDARDPEEKSELVLTAENYHRWAKDFASIKLLDETKVPFESLPEPKKERASVFDILGV